MFVLEVVCGVEEGKDVVQDVWDFGPGASGHARRKRGRALYVQRKLRFSLIELPELTDS